MKLKALFTVVASLALSAGVTFAEDTPLAKEMSGINRNLRTLKRQSVDATKKAENLQIIEKIKAHVEAAKKLEPAKTAEQPAADKAAYIEKYKAQMDDVAKGLDALKEAIDKGDVAAFLDRVQRGSGEADFRLAALQEALAALGSSEPDRAKKVLLALSDPTTEPIPKAPGKGAVGAWPGK
jgi:hypothetical protein